MLSQTIIKTNEVLDRLISLSKEDIENIKLANHEEVFKNTKEKEELAYKFVELKNQIDSILVARNRPLDEIFTPEEEKLFDEFRNKLNEFNALHKRFAKLALSVANFYNALSKQLNQEQEVGYNETFKNSNLNLRA